MLHTRRVLRLRAFDYASPGAYFVTVCIQQRACLLGDVLDATTHCSEAGRIATAVWDALPLHYAHVCLDAFIVMPNHVHGIVVLVADVGAGLKPAPTADDAFDPVRRRPGLPEIVRAFKTFSARRINDLRGTVGATVWQRGYYERIVRDEDELMRIRQYIAENPARWADDEENPLCASMPHALPWET